MRMNAYDTCSVDKFLYILMDVLSYIKETQSEILSLSKLSANQNEKETWLHWLQIQDVMEQQMIALKEMVESAENTVFRHLKYESKEESNFLCLGLEIEILLQKARAQKKALIGNALHAEKKHPELDFF